MEQQHPLWCPCEQCKPLHKMAADLAKTLEGMLINAHPVNCLCPDCRKIMIQAQMLPKIRF